MAEPDVVVIKIVKGLFSYTNSYTKPTVTVQLPSLLKDGLLGRCAKNTFGFSYDSSLVTFFGTEWRKRSDTVTHKADMPAPERQVVFYHVGGNLEIP